MRNFDELRGDFDLLGLLVADGLDELLDLVEFGWGVGDEEDTGVAEGGGGAFAEGDARALEQLDDRLAGGEFGGTAGGGFGEGIRLGFRAATIVAAESGREVGRDGEGASEDVLAGFRLRNERDGEVIDLEAEFRLVADVLEGDGERDIAHAEFADAERARIGSGRNGSAFARLGGSNRGRARTADDEVHALAGGIELERVELGRAHAEEVDGLLDGGVFEVDARDDDAAEFFVDVSNAGSAVLSDL